MDEWEWLDRMANALGERSIRREEIGGMLRLSRDVARGVERRAAPLSTYLAGMHVGRRTAEGVDPEQALQEVADSVRPLLPEIPEGPEGRRGGRRRFRPFGRRRMR